MTTQIKYRGHSPLLTCPADVWDLILKSLSPADHARLCLLNKSVQAFIESYLYASFRWAWMSDPPARTFVLFVRSVVQRPQLGHYVRSLALMGVSSPRDVDDLPMSILENNELSACCPTELLYSRGTSDRTWIDQLHAGSMDALVALLISRLPNLTSLHLGPRFTKDNAYLGLMLRSALCSDCVDHSLPKFENLRAVTFKTGHCSDSARPMRQKNTPNVLSFFYLPSIERINTSFDSPDLFTWPASEGRAPVCLSLTELDLARPFRAAHLSNVLSVARHLKTLRWDWYHGGVTSPSGDNDVIDLDQIAAALSLVRESLTDILITAKCTIGANKAFPPPNSKGSLQVLTDFPNVKHLQAPIAFLMGWTREDPHWGLSDVVPRTIESITITDELWYHHHTYVWNDRAVLDVVKAWLADPEKLPPNLRHCRLVLKGTLRVDFDVESNELNALGARSGVEIEISRQRRKSSLKWLPRAV